MIKQGIKSIMRSIGFEIRRTRPSRVNGNSLSAVPAAQSSNAKPPPPPVAPVWPLPRAAGGLSDEQIREAFARFSFWHYAYEFEGGLKFAARHSDADAVADAAERPLQRFRHFMPYLVDACGGSLRGKRVLDIACNSGFWSIQCALLGAEVVGFDARPELIEQAKLIASIVGASNTDFKVLDYWAMTPEALGGTFDAVLNLGVLYHLPSPIEALRITKSMSRGVILLDTVVHMSNDSVVKLGWEEPFDIRAAHTPGLVAYPSRKSIELICQHIGAREWLEIPVRSQDMPRDYLERWRASWVIKA